MTDLERWLMGRMRQRGTLLTPEEREALLGGQHPDVIIVDGVFGDEDASE